MSQYTDFSYVYDLFMDNVPYKLWAFEIIRILNENGIEDGLVLDLGCGTGTLTRLLADRGGYDMIGVDSSEDMLAVARDNIMNPGIFSVSSGDESENDGPLTWEEIDSLLNDEESTENNILYLCQDISEFELYGTVRAVVSTCDTFNYVTEPEKLLKTFKLVNNYIESDGVFIFDMNAPEKYEEVLTDNVFAENREEASFIWENSFDKDSRINEYALTLFIKDEETGLFEKSEEFHYQRAYTREEIAKLLDEAGFEIIDRTEKDMRMFYVCKVIEGRKLGNY